MTAGSRWPSLPPIDYRAIRIPPAARIPPECQAIVARAQAQTLEDDAPEPTWKERWRRLLARRRSTPS